ncbi:DUF4926 domain-containing protein [Crocosphaera sp.]|uniref:DUF4926 domain-containing protein n=1 Tax=Crocosphaera sp. TaxID=2729996 RepID=UPI002639AB44|nr:DUF4926 domain-containing protein [Crocosphaera sp.]MDJ0582454.1 DUF4926 domain-containing protein [Crocosphaera sp.]
MKTDKVKLLDVVALTVDLPEDKLFKGQVGTVVDILANGTAYEVEFSDRNGRTYESLGLSADQFMILYFEPINPNSTSEMIATKV